MRLRRLFVVLLVCCGAVVSVGSGLASADDQICPGMIPADETPGEGPGKETFVEVPEELRPGRTYKGEVAMFEVEKRFDGVSLRVTGKRLALVGEPTYRWDADETLVKFKFRVRKQVARGVDGRLRLCVRLTDDKGEPEERSAETWYRTK